MGYVGRGWKWSKESRNKLKKWIKENYEEFGNRARGKKRSKKFRLDRANDVKNGVSGFRLSAKSKFVDRLGRIFVMRSSWEIKFAKHLDQQLIDWEYEPFPILLDSGKVYLPDFFVKKTKTIYEVKGMVTTDVLLELDQVRSLGYKVVLCDRQYLISIGINLTKKEKSTKITNKMLIKSFEALVDKQGAISKLFGTRCWEWLGKQFFKKGGRSFYPIRFSHQAYIGTIPKDKVVYRVCGNRNCVNPEHIKAGSRRDIIETTEKYGKGNHKKGKEHPNYKDGKRCK